MSVVTSVGKLDDKLNTVTKGLKVDVSSFKEKISRVIIGDETGREVTNIYIKTALENIDEANPDWTYVASRFYLEQLYTDAMNNRKQKSPYESFYSLVKRLTEIGIYTPVLLEKYSEKDIVDLGNVIE